LASLKAGVQVKQTGRLEMGNRAITDREMLKEGQGNIPGKKSGVYYI